MECLGENYFWFLVVENINFYELVCAEEMPFSYVAESIQGSWMTCVYALDNIEMDIKEMAFMITRSENILINTRSGYRHC